jgi:hypothetical protein
MRVCMLALGGAIAMVCTAAVYGQDSAPRTQAPGATPAAPPQGPSPAQGSTAAPAPAARPAPPPPSPAAIKRAAEILDASRKALGGEKLAALRTMVATGRTRRVRGENLQPIEFEINIERPDKYMRKDEFPAEEAAPTSSGFNGDALIQDPAPPTPPARAGAPPPQPAQLAQQRRARVQTLQQEFARLSLGLFADSLPAYPLTFAYVARAQAPQGTAEVLDVTGPGNFAARFFVHSETHLPIMVSWSVPVPNAAPAEHRLYFSDYREVDGLRLPFLLRRAVGPDTTEETTFDRFRLDTRIPPQKFRPLE